MSDLDQILIPHLTKEEGFVNHAYQDHMGYWTIGIGRMIDERRGGGITREEAEYLLSNDIWRVKTQLNEQLHWWQDLDIVRRAVLAAMVFQMGMKGLLSFKNTLRYVESGQYEKAAWNMRQSAWARQTPARAERCAMAMETGEARWLLG